MKTYVMMFDIANFISGGPIYGCNKINFLKERGWNVVLFPTNQGKVYIDGLKEYSNECYSFIHRNPFLFSKKIRNKFLKQLIKKIDLNSEETIIETGTDFTAYWGELLAKEINAKHIILLLDEYNERINENVIDFWKFKRLRKELFCISPIVMKKYFEKYEDIKDDECYSFNAYCNNSIKDYENEFSKKIIKGDYTIGIVGRLEKIYVNNIINTLCKFSKDHCDKKIVICFFGGAPSNTIKQIKNTLKKHKNITYYISGYMWPIPLNALKKCDLFISGAGSAKVTANINIPTIAIDIYNGKAIGFIEDHKKIYLVSNLNNKKSLETYINEVLLYNKKITVKNKIELDRYWDIICEGFDKQLKDCLNNDIIKEYYDLEKILSNLSFTNKIYKGLVFIFGYKFSEYLRKIYCILFNK